MIYFSLELDDAISMLTANRSKQLDDAKHNITAAQKRQKEQYDRKHSRPQNFEIGIKVL